MFITAFSEPLLCLLSFTAIGNSLYAEIQLTSDPFDMEEPDPAKCRALESCLWELKVSLVHLHCTV